MLEALGLSSDEERVYRALVTDGPQRADELRDQLGLLAEQADEVIGRLAAQGLITHGTEDRTELSAAPPNVAGEVLLLRRMAELQSARAALGQLATAYRKTQHRSGSLDGILQILPQRAVAQQLEQIQQRARREVLMFDVPPYTAQEAGSPPNAVQLERLRAGVRYRTVYDRLSLESAGAIDRITGYVSTGEQARVMDRIPLKMVIVDRELALLPVASRPERDHNAVLLYPGALLDALLSLFELVWLCALPIDPVLLGDQNTAADAEGDPAAAETALTPADRRLLTLLLSGMTDDMISRQFGIARRTVQRRVKTLMAQAGAETRMQLGWQAAQLGWLPAPWKRTGLRRAQLPRQRQPGAVP
ncbi:helix-turn-helix domain-containing protein [Streptomyces sp. NPDC051940]|uniref:helix-turn-helix domain-containing protein n=1 Tax=Streptomyces sp. NPDC051940 TaxID=3155675 RepID=UPI0034131D19